MMKRRIGRAAACAIVLAVAASAGPGHVAVVLGQVPAEMKVPYFEPDPWWPKQLPNHWIVGAVIGVAVDAKDNIWIVHRPSVLTNYEKGAALNPPTSECCVPAPQVLLFDQAGNLLRSWGGPG